MVEPLLYAALGFLTASLVALFMGRALWGRAVRLTTHRIMRRLPLSRDEIVASRDLLRAEQAIEFRRLERMSNVMRQRMTQSMSDIGKRDAANYALRTSINELTQKLSTTQAEGDAARQTIEKLQAEIATLSGKLKETESSLSDTVRAQKLLDRERAELVQLADTRRAEVAAAANEIAQLRINAVSLEKQITALAKERDAVREQLQQARNNAHAQTEAPEITSRLSGMEADYVQLQSRIEDNARLIEALRTDKAALESELAQAKADLRDAERGAANESAEEIALLRQQIEWLASDIARVSSQADERSGSSGGSGVLQSAVRASREADVVAAAPLAGPPVR